MVDLRLVLVDSLPELTSVTRILNKPKNVRENSRMSLNGHFQHIWLLGHCTTPFCYKVHLHVLRMAAHAPHNCAHPVPVSIIKGICYLDHDHRVFLQLLEEKSASNLAPILFSLQCKYMDISTLTALQQGIILREASTSMRSTKA